jgi:hypothetical protein
LPPEELANSIEAVHELKTEEEKAAARSRLGVLDEAELGLEYRRNPSCRLKRGNLLLLVARQRGAIARIDGALRPLGIAGPVGPSGGFFEAPGITVSVGRRAETAPDGDAPGTPFPASATIGGLKDAPPERIDANWTCVL